MDLSLPGDADDGEDASAFRPRRGERMNLHGRTQLRSTDLQCVDVVVRDLSTSGFMAECIRPVLIGSFVSLNLPGIGPVNAQVRWQVGGRLGGRFLDPVGLHRCAWATSEY